MSVRIDAVTGKLASFGLSLSAFVLALLLFDSSGFVREDWDADFVCSYPVMTSSKSNSFNVSAQRFQSGAQ